MEESKERTTPQEFLDWLSFWELNPPIRKLLNYCQAKICYTITATKPRAKGSRAPDLKDFFFDFEAAAMTDQEKTDAKIRKFFSK